MRISLIAILILSTFSMKGQQLSRTHLAAASNFSKDSKGTSINWTMGDIFSETIQEKQHLTGGFQQGVLQTTNDNRLPAVPKPTPKYSNEEHTLNKSKGQQTLSINAYPNPTVNLLTLNFSVPTSGVVMIFENTGKMVFQQEIGTTHGQQIELPQVGQLSPGLYFIHFYQGQKKMVSKSFVKI